MSYWESSGKSNEWYTPRYIFDCLGCSFDQDVAATSNIHLNNVPAKSFITEESLMKEWTGFVWCNPPFGKRNGIAPWLDKMYLHGNGIALTPDRTSAPWWQDAARKSNAHLQINGKVKFIRPDGSTGDSPSNGTTLFAYGDMAVDCLKRADRLGLGICLKMFV